MILLKKEEKKNSEAFTGYQESKEKMGSGDIRLRQQSCMIKDLASEEVPEFWKQINSGQPAQPKLSTKEIVSKVGNTFIYLF